jgi:hypothetical protein
MTTPDTNRPTSSKPVSGCRTVSPAVSQLLRLEMYSRLSVAEATDHKKASQGRPLKNVLNSRRLHARALHAAELHYFKQIVGTRLAEHAMNVVANRLLG